ncbi:MerR family transcriptional regulator [Pediococcus damnosus]|uniref:MerR family transcriptional regulator n=1 Tax=Pediococcus damnosus TaxID=51663 RepID=UPI0007140892|nr:MerR family transcriptional regulator [Pediococcus damnosus]
MKILKIDAVAKQFHISTATLRYYERENLLGPIKRVNGIRNFQSADLKRIDFILCVKECGMTLGQIKHFLEIYQQGDETVAERLSILQKQLGQSEVKAAQLDQSMQHLKAKIKDVQALMPE